MACRSVRNLGMTVVLLGSLSASGHSAPLAAVALTRAEAPPVHSGHDANGPTKRALIVAISSYEPRTLWPYIHSTNDVPLVQRGLAAQGFQEVHLL